MKNIIRLLIITLFTTITLFGCKEEEGVEPMKNKLVAVAGENMAAMVQQQVTLDGSASHDGNQMPFTFQWTIKTAPAGSAATLLSPKAAKTKFTPDKAGVYVIQLAINQENWTAKDELLLTVASANPGEPTTVLISNDITSNTILSDIIADPAQPDYIVTKDISIRGDVTINPGVTIVFEQHKGLDVMIGSLNAKGTAEKPIVFTGLGETNAYWRGIVIHTNSELNEFDHVTIEDAGSQIMIDAPIKANVAVVGNSYSSASLKIRNSKFSGSGGHGLYVVGASTLGAFENNSFFENQAAGAFLPASELHLIDEETEFYNNTLIDGVETYGTVEYAHEVKWKKLSNAAYLVSNSIVIKSGVVVEAGAIFKVKANTSITVLHPGYLTSVGTQAEKIIFTSAKTNEHWNGIYFNTQSPKNIISFSEVSGAGFSKVGDSQQPGNITLGLGGQLVLNNSTIKDGLGYGVVAPQVYQVNADIATVNTFANLIKGSVLPNKLNYPDWPSLSGHWVDQFTLTKEHTQVELDYFNQETGTWFLGAANPWAMTSGKGTGLFIDDNGNFVWSIAEQSPMSGCESYSAEYITGKTIITDDVITFNQEYWRSKFINACEPDQNVDIEVETSQIPIRYEIEKMYNVFTGEAVWRLKFTNPDNSVFFLYRK